MTTAKKLQNTYVPPAGIAESLFFAVYSFFLACQSGKCEQSFLSKTAPHALQVDTNVFPASAQPSRCLMPRNIQA